MIQSLPLSVRGLGYLQLRFKLQDATMCYGIFHAGSEQMGATPNKNKIVAATAAAEMLTGAIRQCLKPNLSYDLEICK